MKPTNNFERRLMNLVDNGKVHPLTRSEVKQALAIWNEPNNKRLKYFYFENSQTIDDIHLIKVFKGYKETFGSYYFQLVAIRATNSNGEFALAGVSKTIGCYCDTFLRYGEITIKKSHKNGYFNDVYSELTDDFGVELSSKSRKNTDVGLIFSLGCNTHVVGKGTRRCPFNTRLETMVECGYHDFASYLVFSPYLVETYWSTIKIAMKNKYKVRDWSMYIDYIQMLERNGKDIHNAHYVCPTDFEHSHDWIMRIDNIRAEQVAQQLAHAQKRYANEEEFNKYHAYLFGIAFDNGNLFLNSLDSVQAYKDEGKLMTHCVGGYWSKQTALILHCADSKGNAIATIEIDIANKCIVQIRAKHNSRPKEFNEITRLVKDNLDSLPKFKPLKNVA